jgi:hypothetical protein
MRDLWLRQLRFPSVKEPQGLLAQTRSGSLLHHCSLLVYKRNKHLTCGGSPVQILIRVRAKIVAAQDFILVVRTPLMTKHISMGIVTYVLVVAISVVTITIAATSLGEPIVAGIAASIPGTFHFAMESTLAGARPGQPKLARGQTGCRLRSAPLQWNVDWLVGPPAAVTH